ncbi:MAG TPA: D-alanine--D-alanine ligase [Candidatus Aerophobetes bacterium]|uniref:D-alanine--D-alanine ligase n=1 Tax=Aerophobetes bacterium TaxID=2030807 RepID=A0A7V0QS48_UNCAE|nr:D-alanine--D-alanine ligase [Candidatus Aerophobetes bacterium]
MSLRVCVLKGGSSAEREISLRSGEVIEEALQKLGYSTFSIDPEKPERMSLLLKNKVDVVFIALHGPGGEDGTVQGVLEIFDVPYTGSGVLASALAMDKKSARRIWKAEGLKQPVYQIVKRNSLSNIKLEIPPPLIVKPGRSGSTLGVNLVREERELEDALKEAFKYDGDYVILEEYIEGKELTVGIIDDPEPIALPVIEIVPEGVIYDYKTKYTEGKCKYKIPAALPQAEYKKVQEIALRAYKSLGCRDFGRVDMIWREEEVYLLEVNTIPGMTRTSLLPRAAKAKGIEFHHLVDKIVKQALRRKQN